MIINQDELQKLLLKKKTYDRKFEESKFLVNFNNEAIKQGNEWFAEFQGDFLHICKINKKWLSSEKVSLFVSFSDGYFHFVDNDYAVTEYAEEKNEEALSSLREFKTVLENIPQKFFYFTDYTMEDFNKRMEDIETRLGKLEVD